MIIEQAENTIESSGILKELQFGIKSENMGFILNVLRNSLYGDKLGSVIREYSNNSFDSHVQSGQETRPIKITLPSQFESTFRVRDYGAGLSEDDVKDVFVNYGCSTKRGSNKLIGAYGLGSKVGWSLSDVFSVNSYQNGTLFSYSLYIDESQRGKMSLMSKTQTDEPDGLEVSIPIPYSDIHSFKEKAVKFFRFWNILPEFENLGDSYKASLESYRNESPVFSGDSWKTFNDQRESYAIMGNVGYKIDRYVWGTELDENLKSILGNGCYLFFNIGDFSVTASRESLEYDKKTKKVITDRLKEILEKIKEEITEKFVGCKTLWEAKCLYNQVFDQTGKYYHYRNVVKNVLTFNGTPLNSDSFKVDHNQNIVASSLYKKERGRRYHSAEKIKRTPYVYDIHASDKNIVILNDIHLDKGIMNRIVPLIEEGTYKTIYFLEFKDDAQFQAFQKDTGFDGPTLKVSDLPKVNLTKYYPKTSSSGTPYGNPFAYKKVFELNQSLLGGYQSRCSAYWSETEIDYDNDSGVYFEISDYKIVNKNESTDRPDNFNDKLNLLANCGIKIPTLYGIKKSALSKIKDNENMVSFFDWLKEQVENLIKSEWQDLIDYKDVFLKLVQDHQSVERYLSTIGTSNLGKDNEIHLFNASLIPLRKNKIKLESIIALAQIAGVAIGGKSALPSPDKQIQALRKKYPMFFRLIGLTTDYKYDKNIVGELEDYVKMIDDCV